MKRLTYFFLFLPMLLSAQSANSIEIFGAHGLSYEPNSFLKELNLQDNYRAVNVSRFGFGASLKLGRQTYARTTVQWSQYGYGWGGELRWGTQHDGDGGFDPTLPPGPASSVETVNRDNYVEGLVSFGYQLPTRGRWKPIAEAGLGIGKYLTSRGRIDYEPDVDSVSEEVQSMVLPEYYSSSFVARLGVGTNYELNARLAIYGMAVYQRHLRTINEIGPARIYPWQATLEVGLRTSVGKRRSRN